MKEIRSILEKVKLDLQEGISEEEMIPLLRPILENGPETASQFIEELMSHPSPPVARLFQRLLEIPCEKKIRKMIKRSLYRLKGKGIAVEQVSVGNQEPIFKPLQAEPPRGFGGPFDFLGKRFLMLVVPHKGRGLTVMQGMVSDTEGLVDFSGGEMARKRFKLFYEEIQKGTPFPFVEMEPSYTGFLFAQAYRLTLERGKASPRDYLLLKGEVDRIKKEYERPLIYSHIREGEIQGDDLILRRGGDLLKTDLFRSWTLGEEDIRPYADAVWEAEESKLILNQAQKQARFQEIYQRALSEIFPEQRRLLYQGRMEEMAYYLLKSGREEESKISLAVAIDLKKTPNLIQPNPFLFQLVVRSIFTVLSDAYERKEKEFSLIAKP